MRRGKLHVYKARDGWRWRLRAGNGRIVAEGGEAYSSKFALMQTLRKLGRILKDARLIED